MNVSCQEMGGCVVPALGVGRLRTGFRPASVGWGQHPPSSCKVQGGVKEIPPTLVSVQLAWASVFPGGTSRAGGRLCSVFSSLRCHLPAPRMDGAD